MHLVFYTNNVKPGFAGQANAFVIRIRPEYKEDKGLLEHEKVHVKQFWRTLGLHGLFYLLSKKYRLKAETEAYREQLCWPPAIAERAKCLDHYSNFLSQKYGLNITAAEARKLLS